MKIRCNRDKLSQGFGLVSPAAKAQSPKAILRNVKLEVHETELVLFATDMELGIRVTIPCDDVETTGCVMLPTDRTRRFLAESEAAFVTIDSNEKRTQMLTDSRFVFSGENPDDFPGTPVFEAQTTVVVKARYLKEAIKRTIFATNDESGRYVLGGVFMDYKDSKLNLVATDGRRLAAQEIDAQLVGEGLEQVSAITTVRSLVMIEKLLTNPEADVCIAMLENQIQVQSENVFCYASLLEGHFPDWRMGLQQIKNPKTINLLVKPFHQAVRLVSIVTEKASPGVVLEFGNGTMCVFAASSELGEMEKDFPIAFDEPSTQMKMNQDFILDFLRQQDQESSIQMHFVDYRTGVLFTTDDGYRYLVMPMQHTPIQRTAPGAPGVESEGAAEPADPQHESGSDVPPESTSDGSVEVGESLEVLSEQADAEKNLEKSDEEA
ncbi:MAG: DNA polymerase III subunit beta [Planctomycetia bacterium]|nr:DNA polymerase III subunit beta [Planctomycetia bacterium]